MGRWDSVLKELANLEDDTREQLREEILHCKSVDMADLQVVQDYADDLRNLLAKSSITEQRKMNQK